MPSFVGIDVVLARALVANWIAIADRVSADGDRAVTLAAAVDVPGPPPPSVAAGLRAIADLLAASTDRLTEWLATGARGWLARQLAEPSPAAWSALVAAGSTTIGPRTVRYVDIERAPGGGVVVADFFIPDDSSLLLDGDGREHADPIFGPLDADDSRALLVLDLERGRASISFDDTCTMWSGWLEVCEEARPIVTEPAFGRLVNEVLIETADGRIEVDYDILNGITPIGSTDGTFTLTAGADGRYAVTELDADEYPSLGVYQYRAGERVDVVLRRDSDGPPHLFPWWPDEPELPELPDLPDRLELPGWPDLPEWRELGGVFGD
jgi:hypothetical protein